MIKICFYGYSGSGKSTASKYMRRALEEQGLSVAVCKLAEPLYKMQEVMYKELGVPIDKNDQHQTLLEKIATCMREIDPYLIINNFFRRLNESEADVVINDDLRDAEVDMPMLKKNGFVFIRVWCSEANRILRLIERNDLNTKIHSELHQSIDKIVPDISVENNFASLSEYKDKIAEMANSLLMSYSLAK